LLDTGKQSGTVTSKKSAGSGAPTEPDSAETSANAPRRDGAGTYLTRRRRLYDKCTHPSNTASARWGIFFAATVHEPSPVPNICPKLTILSVDPKYGVPQRPIGLSALSSCRGFQIRLYGTWESANRRSELTVGTSAIVPAPYIWLMHWLPSTPLR
jgi:hypothetical protein